MKCLLKTKESLQQTILYLPINQLHVLDHLQLNQGVTVTNPIRREVSNLMTVKINADTSDGLKFVSDTSGTVDIQSNGQLQNVDGFIYCYNKT